MRTYLVLLLILFGAVVAAPGQIDYISTVKPSKEDFYEFCTENSILYPEVVWAQARLESGNFTSAHFKNRNNCLGIYDSKRKRYASFDHWTDCVIAYRDRVQYRYKGRIDNTEEYLMWLSRCGYAKDKNYLSKVRTIMRKP